MGPLGFVSLRNVYPEFVAYFSKMKIMMAPIYEHNGELAGHIQSVCSISHNLAPDFHSTKALSTKLFIYLFLK